MRHPICILYNLVRILSLILQHAVAAEFNVLYPLWELDSLLLLLGVLHFLLFGKGVETEA